MAAENKRDRLTKALAHYRGFTFRWQRWETLSAEWDHDHCRGCWARFAVNPTDWKDNVFTEGWVTLWPVGENMVGRAEDFEGYRALPSPKLHGFQLDWLCPECFDTCKGELAFVDNPRHPQWMAPGLSPGD